MGLAERRGRRAILIAITLAVLAAVLVVLADSFVVVDRGADLAPERAARDDLMAWFARILFVLGAIWITIGALAARTRLVRRPGAAAARATWLSFSRPWRARESMLGLLPLDRWLMIIVPAGMIIATHLVVASFLSILPVLIAGAGWFVFGMVAVVLIWPRSAWPVIAAVSGTAIVWSLVMLAGVAIWGPGRFWQLLWSTASLRFVVATIVFGVLAWALIAAGGAMTPQVGAMAASGIVLASIGATVAVVNLAIAVLGPQWVGAQWEDETVELAGDVTMVWVIVGFGAVLSAAGLILARIGKRKSVSV